MKIINLALLTMLLCFGLASCSKDDDLDAGTSYMVGTWVCVEDDEYEVTFRSNGTGYENEDGDIGNFRYECVANRTENYDYDIIFYWLDERGNVEETYDAQHIIAVSNKKCRWYSKGGSFDGTFIKR